VKLRIHLFEWPSRHNVHLALPLMLVLSFALHAASMFLFHTAFPSSNGSAERIASITYILPGSPEASKLAPILAASDPALFSPADVGPNVWDLPKTAYVASFDEETPDLRPLPAPAPSEFLPPEPGTAPVTEATIVPKASLAPQPAPPTSVQFGGGLEKRAWTPPEGFKFSDVRALTQQGRAPAEFLVAVSPDGLPLHFFPQQSSGDENLDRAALRYLAGCRFAPAPAETEPAWGTALFLWGGDIAAETQP
jgi:outer membrane biosynthesis protein TonB